MNTTPEDMAEHLASYIGWSAKDILKIVLLKENGQL
jgi:hypothetical protein